jgi:hypothetical protein
MHYDYVVILKRENARKTDWVSFLLLTFSILSFCFVQIRIGFSMYRFIAILILLTGVLINILAIRQEKKVQFRIWLFVAGIFWIGMPFLQWLVLPFFLFAFLEIQAKYPLEIGFNPEGIVINSLFRKKFPWSSLESVILKDGMLTLDFRNNRLLQKEVLDDDQPDASEDEFNAYCRGKLVNLHP